MNYAEINERVAVVVALTAPAVSAGFKAAVGNALRRQTGRSRRSFNPTIRRDRSTGEVWGVSFRTYRYVYMHHHGWAGGQVNRGEFTYNSKGYAKTNLLTPPAERGAVIIADAVVPVMADAVVSGVKI